MIDRKPEHKRITASWWRCLLINLAFAWNLSGRAKLSKWAWRASRWLATEKTHMALAAYCAGIMIDARMRGEYEDKREEVIGYGEEEEKEEGVLM